jgi:Cys-rich four helix bundle protein (predicted Tat secretion target)
MRPYSRKQIIGKSAKIAGAVALVTVAGNLLADDKDKKANTYKPKYRKAMESASECLTKAQICQTHCIEDLASGSKMLADCLRTVNDVISACTAFISIASANSKFSKKTAELCIDICEACQKECKKHASHHEICKECGESCKACIEELKKVA